MPLTEEVLGTNADGSKNEDYCMYCYKDGKFLQECTMDEMVEHCAQFVDEVDVFPASETLAQGVDTYGFHAGESRSGRREGTHRSNG